MKNWMDATHTTHEQALLRVAQATDRVFRLLDKFHGAGRFNASLAVQSNADAQTQSEQRDRAKEVWGGEIAKLVPAMLNAGIAKTKGTDFPPSLGQFIEACKPTAEAAFYEAQGGMSARSRGLFGDWTCPAVYWAAIAFGSSDLKTAQWNFHGKRWAKIFADLMQKQEAGLLEPIPQPVPENARIGHERIRASDAAKVEAAAKEVSSLAKRTGVHWAWVCKSITAAKLLVDGLNGAHADTLAEAGKHHLSTGKVARNGDAWKIGAYWGAGHA
ncbi:hypothetical protein GCM10009007_03120 [Formosimonas limnophila]|uniref:Uncharacterized protein n=1 Tax=Formosimonas limnophila TaxID=1384487 RepID=A0A8J3CLC7_9BURK|nr:hypothetical protein [Formosimonas limnophila]GHA66053.1 hypothetical protein GCM10009007_03120 [Formosimonas limnophila]